MGIVATPYAFPAAKQYLMSDLGTVAQGETWTLSAGGERYQRWWGEDHFGNGWVRKHGNSTTGARRRALLLLTQGIHHLFN